MGRSCSETKRTNGVELMNTLKLLECGHDISKFGYPTFYSNKPGCRLCLWISLRLCKCLHAKMNHDIHSYLIGSIKPNTCKFLGCNCDMYEEVDMTYLEEKAKHKQDANS